MAAVSFVDVESVFSDITSGFETGTPNAGSTDTCLVSVLTFEAGTVSYVRAGGSGGTDMNLAISGHGVNYFANIYHLKNTNNYVRAQPTTIFTRAFLTAESYENVNQTTPTGDTDDSGFKANYSSVTPSVTLTTTSGDMAIGAVYGDDYYESYSTISFSGGTVTAKHEDTSPYWSGASIRKAATGSSVTLNPTITGCYAEGRVAGAVLQQSVGGGPATQTSAGSLEAADADITGTAYRQLPTSGALEAGDSDIAGIAIRQIISAGSLESGDAAIDGAATAEAIEIATGALEAGDAEIAGAAIREIIGAGTLSADDAALIGAAVRIIVGAGTLESSDAALDGAAEITGQTAGSGALESGDSDIIGTAVRELVASGALTAGDAEIVGALVREITGSGSLESGPAHIHGTDQTPSPVSLYSTVYPVVSAIVKSVAKAIIAARKYH